MRKRKAVYWNKINKYICSSRVHGFVFNLWGLFKQQSAFKGMRIIMLLKMNCSYRVTRISETLQSAAGEYTHIGRSNGQVNAIQKPQSQLYTDHTQKGSSGESRTYTIRTMEPGIDVNVFHEAWMMRERAMRAKLCHNFIATSSPHFSGTHMRTFFYHAMKTKIFPSKRNIRGYAEFGNNCILSIALWLSYRTFNLYNIIRIIPLNIKQSLIRYNLK